jgi:hypothetical protein
MNCFLSHPFKLRQATHLSINIHKHHKHDYFPTHWMATQPSLFLDEDDVLVPIRIDLVHKGTHYIDTFTWNLYNSICTVEEFVIKLCSDLNFPVTFISLISSQMYQQIDSYFILFSLLYHNISPNLLQQIQDLIIDINLCRNVLEYSDKFQYNPNSLCCNPEKFAQVTCSDLGLPPEMEPTIAFNIREATIRYTPFLKN